jgi:hypothetical protein
VLKRDDEFKKASYIAEAFFTFVTELSSSVLRTNVELKGNLLFLCWQHRDMNNIYCSKE